MWFERLTRAFAAHADREAFRTPSQSITYGDLERRALRYAEGLVALGVRPGDCVAVLAGSCVELVVAMLGHYYVGAVHTPINTRYGAHEIAHILHDSGARLAVFDAEHREALDAVWTGPTVELVPDFETRLPRADLTHSVGDEDVALLIYTSGTTGKSKGVELPHRAVVSNIEALTTLWRWTENDRLVLALPLFHVHGLCIGLHGALLHGCGVDLHERFEPAAVVHAIASGATIFMGVPTMYARLVDLVEQDASAAAALRGARLYTSGSAALSVDHFRRFEAATGHAILERYGMSETLLTLSNPYDGERRPGTVGHPVPGCEVRIVRDDFSDCDAGESGQILVRGTSMMLAYRGLPQQTAASFHQGWFLTGDIAERAADGYIRIVGRASTDILKSGGFKISAREIEDVLATHPDVVEVAVVGLADETWGERIAAVVATRVERDPKDLLAELQALGRDHLADFKTVRALACVACLPRNAMGKVQKHLMKALDFVGV